MPITNVWIFLAPKHSIVWQHKCSIQKIYGRLDYFLTKVYFLGSLHWRVSLTLWDFTFKL